MEGGVWVLGGVVCCYLVGPLFLDASLARMQTIREDQHVYTSIFLNSVHLASSALSGLTRLILGACGIVRVLAERVALADVLFR